MGVAMTATNGPRVPTEEDRKRLDLDRKPPRDECGACGMSLRECWDVAIACCARCEHPDIDPWEFWFTVDGEYLGTRSARTGPDDVGAAQRCGCEQCAGTLAP